MSDLTKLEAEFKKFHADNPKVYELFKQFALQAIAAGRKKLSVSLIIERIRWECVIATTSNDEFKINNNHRAYYARKFMQDFPKHAGLFSTRVTKGEAKFGTEATL